MSRDRRALERQSLEKMWVEQWIKYILLERRILEVNDLMEKSTCEKYKSAIKEEPNP